jgi:hypothetical protein
MDLLILDILGKDNLLQKVWRLTTFQADKTVVD